MPNTNAKAESRAPQVPSLLSSPKEIRKKRKWFLCPDMRTETHSTMLSVVMCGVGWGQSWLFGKPAVSGFFDKKTAVSGFPAGFLDNNSRLKIALSHIFLTCHLYISYHPNSLLQHCFWFLCLSQLFLFQYLLFSFSESQF